LAKAAAGSTGALLSMAGPVIEKAYGAGPCSGHLNDIEHFVLFMQENRSFDHYFGTLSGTNGFDSGSPLFAQKGWDPQTRKLDPAGVTLPYRFDTTRGPLHDGECLNDPDHSWVALHNSWNGGANDNWLPAQAQTRSVAHTPTVMGYYTREDIPVHYLLADAFTLCDQYFCSVLGPTLPNRLYWLSATIDPDGQYGGPELESPALDPIRKFSWRTMPQNLSDAGVSWKVYRNKTLGPVVSSLTFGNFVNYFKQTGAQNSDSARFGLTPTYPASFVADVRANKLPRVSWVIPNVLECEHPATLPAAGALALVNIIKILMSNPAVWEKTALIVSYDENGGFFDHVTPPTPPPGTPGEYISVPDINTVAGSGGIRGPIGLGFRVPCFVISPYSRGGLMAHGTFDHTSQLRLIETRFGVPVPNLTPWRRGVTGDMTSAFNFAATPDLSRPNLDHPGLETVQKLPQCIPNVALGTVDLGIPYRVPYPQAMPIQETSPTRAVPSGLC
jgi:phospholipase C